MAHDFSAVTHTQFSYEYNSDEEEATGDVIEYRLDDSQSSSSALASKNGPPLDGGDKLGGSNSTPVGKTRASARTSAAAQSRRGRQSLPPTEHAAVGTAAAASAPSHSPPNGQQLQPQPQQRVGAGELALRALLSGTVGPSHQFLNGGGAASSSSRASAAVVGGSSGSSSAFDLLAALPDNWASNSPWAAAVAVKAELDTRGGGAQEGEARISGGGGSGRGAGASDAPSPLTVLQVAPNHQQLQQQQCAAARAAEQVPAAAGQPAPKLGAASHGTAPLGDTAQSPGDPLPDTGAPLAPPVPGAGAPQGGGDRKRPKHAAAVEDDDDDAAIAAPSHVAAPQAPHVVPSSLQRPSAPAHQTQVPTPSQPAAVAAATAGARKQTDSRGGGGLGGGATGVRGGPPVPAAIGIAPVSRIFPSAMPAPQPTRQPSAHHPTAAQPRQHEARAAGSSSHGPPPPSFSQSVVTSQQRRLPGPAAAAAAALSAATAAAAEEEDDPDLAWFASIPGTVQASRGAGNKGQNGRPAAGAGVTKRAPPAAAAAAAAPGSRGVRALMQMHHTQQQPPAAGSSGGAEGGWRSTGTVGNPLPVAGSSSGGSAKPLLSMLQGASAPRPGASFSSSSSSLQGQGQQRPQQEARPRPFPFPSGVQASSAGAHGPQGQRGDLDPMRGGNRMMDVEATAPPQRRSGGEGSGVATSVGAPFRPAAAQHSGNAARHAGDMDPPGAPLEQQHPQPQLPDHQLMQISFNAKTSRGEEGDDDDVMGGAPTAPRSRDSLPSSTAPVPPAATSPAVADTAAAPSRLDVSFAPSAPRLLDVSFASSPSTAAAAGPPPPPSSGTPSRSQLVVSPICPMGDSFGAGTLTLGALDGIEPEEEEEEYGGGGAGGGASVRQGGAAAAGGRSASGSHRPSVFETAVKQKRGEAGHGGGNPPDDEIGAFNALEDGGSGGGGRGSAAASVAGEEAAADDDVAMGEDEEDEDGPGNGAAAEFDEYTMALQQPPPAPFTPRLKGAASAHAPAAAGAGEGGPTGGRHAHPPPGFGAFLSPVTLIDPTHGTSVKQALGPGARFAPTPLAGARSAGAGTLRDRQAQGGDGTAVAGSRAAPTPRRSLSSLVSSLGSGGSSTGGGPPAFLLSSTSAPSPLDGAPSVPPPFSASKDASSSSSAAAAASSKAVRDPLSLVGRLSALRRAVRSDTARVEHYAAGSGAAGEGGNNSPGFGGVAAGPARGPQGALPSSVAAAALSAAADPRRRGCLYLELLPCCPLLPTLPGTLGLRVAFAKVVSVAGPGAPVPRLSAGGASAALSSGQQGQQQQQATTAAVGAGGGPGPTAVASSSPAPSRPYTVVTLPQLQLPSLPAPPGGPAGNGPPCPSPPAPRELVPGNVVVLHISPQLAAALSLEDAAHQRAVLLRVLAPCTLLVPSSVPEAAPVAPLHTGSAAAAAGGGSGAGPRMAASGSSPQVVKGLLVCTHLVERLPTPA